MRAGGILLSRQLYDYLEQHSGYIGPDGYICKFDSLTDIVPKQSEFRFDQLPECLFAHIEVSNKASGRLCSFNTYKLGATRGESGVDEVFGMGYDCDDLTAGFDPLTLFYAFPDAPMVIYSTHSHTPEKPKYRVILFLASPIPARFYKEVWTVLSARFSVKVDPAPSSAASIFFLPSCKPGAERVMLTQSISNRSIQAEPFDWTVIFHNAKVKPEAPAPVRKAHVTDETPDSILICERCKTMNYALEVGGDIPEPWWFATLKVAAACEPDITLELSNGYRGFKQSELDFKLQQITDKEYKPARCDFFKQHSDMCAGCEWDGLIGSPVALGFARLPSKRRRAGVTS